MPRRTEADPFLSVFGATVRKLRKNAGFSLDKLAVRTDIVKGSLSNIEHGRTNVTVITCMRIAEGLGVDVATLFVDEGKANPRRARR